MIKIPSEQGRVTGSSNEPFICLYRQLHISQRRHLHAMYNMNLYISLRRNIDIILSCWLYIINNATSCLTSRYLVCPTLPHLSIKSMRSDCSILLWWELVQTTLPTLVCTNSLSSPPPPPKLSTTYLSTMSLNPGIILLSLPLVLIIEKKFKKLNYQFFLKYPVMTMHLPVFLENVIPCMYFYWHFWNCRYTYMHFYQKF